jgi:putative transposase
VPGRHSKFDSYGKIHRKAPFREPVRATRKGIQMDEYESLNHTKWDCKFHVVFIPKYRRKTLFGEIRRELGPVFRALTERRESRVEEGHLMSDHVHMLLSIPPKYAVATVIGFMKGKSAIHIARTYLGVRRNYVGQSFWARGYFVSTVGRDEAAIREYIKNQEAEDKRIDQMKLLT